MRMGAIGVTGDVLGDGAAEALALRVKADAMWVSIENERTADLAGTEGDVTRVRVALEAERSYESERGVLTPSAEIGLRHDGGDAETGTGVELGAGVRYEAGALTIEGQVRTLLAHEAEGYEEWGLSGAIHVAPGSGGRGLTLSIAPAWGASASATERLWNARDAGEVGDDSFEYGARIATDVGYGFALPQARGMLTPYAGTTIADGERRTYRLGTRWQPGPDAALSVEAARSESGAESDGVNALMLRGALRF